MTPAEKTTQTLEVNAGYGLPEGPTMYDAAALIRRLAAALIEFHAAYKAGGWATYGIEERHAEALRDVKGDV